MAALRRTSASDPTPPAGAARAGGRRRLVWRGGLDELLALLHDELPIRRAIAAQAAGAAPPVVCRDCVTVQACLTFLPTDGGEVLFAAATTEATPPSRARCCSTPTDTTPDAPGLPRGCPGAATLAAAPATAVMEDFSLRPAARRPPAAAKRRRGGGGGGAGEWTCSACTLVNAARASRCGSVRAAASWRRGGAAILGRPAAGARAARRVVGRRRVFLG